MDTIFAQTATQTNSPTWRRWLTSAILAAVLVAALVAAFVAEASMSTGDAVDTGLSSQQIVTRGEVADRYQVTGNGGLSAQQIVTRGEVADRYAK